MLNKYQSPAAEDVAGGQKQWCQNGPIQKESEEQDSESAQSNSNNCEEDDNTEDTEDTDTAASKEKLTSKVSGNGPGDQGPTANSGGGGLTGGIALESRGKPIKPVENNSNEAGNHATKNDAPQAGYLPNGMWYLMPFQDKLMSLDLNRQMWSAYSKKISWHPMTLWHSLTKLHLTEYWTVMTMGQ